jgi:hypothetical protein
LRHPVLASAKRFLAFFSFTAGYMPIACVLRLLLRLYSNRHNLESLGFNN